MASAVSRISRISAGVRSAMPSRSLWRSVDSAGTVVTCSIMVHRHFIGAVNFRQADVHVLLRRRRHVLADIVGLDRQFAMPAIDQHDELDLLRAAEINQRIE